MRYIIGEIRKWVLVLASRINIKKMKGGECMGNNKMTSKAASRIQSNTAKGSNGKVPKGSFASRAQRAATKGSKK